MTPQDLARYEAIRREPTRIGYRGLDVYGMGPPSSGGSTVGETLNILEGYRTRRAPRELTLHRYLEASKLAYADRGAYLADPAYFDVPLRGLLSDAFARDRRALIDDDSVLPAPQPAHPDPYRYEHRHGRAARPSSDDKGRSTTHLTVADRWGNVVSYTFTIEAIGGSGIVVPGRGFLLNNELTDFNFQTGTANSPDGGKRPRSSMAPTIVLDAPAAGGRARLAGRRDDHHHRPAGARPPPRLRAEPARTRWRRRGRRSATAASTPAETAFTERLWRGAEGARAHVHRAAGSR